MLDVHPPNESAHTWRSFLIHIATIVIGLFIAAGLEQTVEYFHHRHQRAQLEEQMHDAFVFDQTVLIQGLDASAKFRAYLVDLRAAIVALREGKKGVPQPPLDDPRMRFFSGTPTFAPHDAAQENGTVAQLPAAEIRLFNCIVLQRKMYNNERDHWLWSLVALQAFSEGFVDASGLMQYGQIVNAPDLALLSPPDLNEYLGLVTIAIKHTDVVSNREKLIYLIVTTALGDVHSEEELVEMIRQTSFDHYEGPRPSAAEK